MATTEVEIEIAVTVKVKVKAERRFTEIEGRKVATGFDPVAGTVEVVGLTPEALDKALWAHLNGDGGEIDMFDYACFKAAGIDPRSIGQE